MHLYSASCSCTCARDVSLEVLSLQEEVQILREATRFLRYKSIPNVASSFTGFWYLLLFWSAFSWLTAVLEACFCIYFNPDSPRNTASEASVPP